jgi:Arabinose efflux permease
MSGSTQGGASYFDGLKIGLTQKRFLWLAAIYYIFDQTDLQTFSLAAPSLIKTWGITPAQIANVNSLGFLGMFFGAVFGGWLSDLIGRKKAIMTCIGIFSLGSVFNGLAVNYLMLLIARFITGFGCVAMVVISMVYIAEMLPSENRGRYQALTIACGTIGVPVIGLFAAWLIPQNPAFNWRIVFFLGGAGLLLIPLGGAWFKESPRWLVSKGRIQEAEVLFEEITGHKREFSQQTTTIKVNKIGNLETLKIMFSKDYRKRSILMVILAWGAILSGSFIGQFYSTMLTKTGMGTAVVLTIISLASWGIPVGDFSASLVSDKGGRKIPICIFMLICGIAVLVQGSSLNPWVIVIGMFGMRIFGGGAISMIYTYLAENFPTRIRNNAVGMIFGTSRLMSSVAQLTVAGLFATYGWFGINVIDAFICFIPAIIILIWGEKTSGRSLEDISSEVESA